MKRSIAIACFFWMAVPSGAAPAPELSETLRPVSGTQAGEWELVGKFSLFSPIHLRTVTDSYTVPWDEGTSGAPTFSVGVATPVFRWGNLQGFGEASVGWSYKKGLHRLLPRDGSAPSQQLVEMHRFPLLGAMKFVYRVGGRGDVKPTLTVGAGVQGWVQRGSVAGLDRFQWVPYYVISPALTFFEREWEQDWFAGFTFGVSYQNALQGRLFSAWSFDLSLNILLL